MANALFMSLRRGSTLRVIEETDDPSPISGNPTAWLVLANTRGDAPQPSAPHIALAVVFDTNRWIMTLMDTTSLSGEKYLFYSRYVLDDGSVYIPDPTPVVMKP